MGNARARLLINAVATYVIEKHHPNCFSCQDVGVTSLSVA
jgi:hypothetical protein